MSTNRPNLWTETPLIKSIPLSRPDCTVYLKLENLHPSAAFKYRGISHFISKRQEENPESHFVIASGGNAGLAAACAAYALKARCTVFIPEGVEQRLVDFLQSQNAEVVIKGKHYAEALLEARRVSETEDNVIVVPAYEEKLVWEGHASMVDEVKRQLPVNTVPNAILCSVGGAGLLGGILIGCTENDWDEVPVVALETIGSNSFHHSMILNKYPTSNFPIPAVNKSENIHDEHSDVHLVAFHAFDSKASGSLGASTPAPGVVSMALHRSGPLTNVSIPDSLAMQTALNFANDHRFLVELSCATALSAAYAPDLLDRIIPSNGQHRTVVFVVCGGFKISTKDLQNYQELLAKRGTSSHEVVIDNGDKLLVSLSNCPV